MDKKGKVVFIRIAWMINYEGITKNDEPIGGGKYIKDNGFGGEIFNFANHRGYYYGGPGWARNFKRIGGSNKDKKINGVTVIWVATNPHIGGQYIIGWYNNATIFKEEQNPPKGSKRLYKKNKISYSIKAPAKKSILLPVDGRLFKIPKAKKGKSGFGQVNVWYADNPKDAPFVKRILERIKKYKKPRIPPKLKKQKRGKGPIQIDIKKRKAVENKSMKVVKKYYENLDYDVEDVHKENQGWDLEATSGKSKLYLEVKGLSGNLICVLETPNEYEKMVSERHKIRYRVCVVTNTLSKNPPLYNFRFNAEKLIDDEGNELRIEVVKSARLCLIGK